MIKAIIAKLLGTKAAMTASMMGVNPVKWSERSAKAYATEGYQKCVVVFRCVDLIGQSIASIPITVNGKDNHPLVALLKRPNPVMSYDDLVGWMVGFHRITGNAYLEALTAGRTPKELWPYMPYSMRVVEPDSRNALIPKGYAYIDGIAQNARTWEVDALTGRCELMHWKTFNPMDRWYGMSPLMAGSMSVDQHNEANIWNMKLLQNNAIPSGALVHTSTLTDSQFQRLKLEMEESYQGSRNARRPMLLEGGMDWKQFAMTPAEMDYLNGKLMSAQDICGAFGVPSQLIPLPGSQTFANFEQARLAFWQDTVIPLSQNFFEKMSRWLTLLTGEAIDIQGNLDEISALESVRAAKWDSVGGASFLTLNEKREALGYDPLDLDGANTLFITGSELPLLTPAETRASEAAAAAAQARVDAAANALPPDNASDDIVKSYVRDIMTKGRSEL